jgi:membrane protein
LDAVFVRVADLAAERRPLETVEPSVAAQLSRRGWERRVNAVRWTTIRATPPRSRPTITTLLASSFTWLALEAMTRVVAREATAPKTPNGETACETRAPDQGRERVSWFALVKSVAINFNRHRVMALSAEMTFYSLLAIFPAIAALVSLYGLFADPVSIGADLQGLAGVLPSGAIELIGGEVKALVATPGKSLGLGFAAGLAIALWSANSGMKSVFDALNVVFEEVETRSFVALTLETLAITCAALVAVIVALAAIVAAPVALHFAGGQDWSVLIAWGRWPALVVVVSLVLSVIYRFGPSRSEAKWRWLTPGSVVASIVWLATSMLFSWYVENFGNYNKTYGSLGAAVGFMTWMWLSGMIVLLGAEIDARTERRSR